MSNIKKANIKYRQQADRIVVEKDYKKQRAKELDNLLKEELNDNAVPLLIGSVKFALTSYDLLSSCMKTVEEISKKFKTDGRVAPKIKVIFNQLKNNLNAVRLSVGKLSAHAATELDNIKLEDGETTSYDKFLCDVEYWEAVFEQISFWLVELQTEEDFEEFWNKLQSIRKPEWTEIDKSNLAVKE